MEFRDMKDELERAEQGQPEGPGLEKRVQDAREARPPSPRAGDPPDNGDGDEGGPGTFRGYDTGRNGEIRTLTESQGMYSVASAEFYRQDGTHYVDGTASYKVVDGAGQIERLVAPTPLTEYALLKEVGEGASAQGADRLRVWVPGDNTSAGNRWLGKGFHPTEPDPGAGGVFWERPL